MKNFFTITTTAGAGLVFMAGLLSAPVYAQDETDRAERQARMEQRRAEFLENNPEVVARMEERRQEREEFRANNPEAAARRQEHLRDRIENGDGRPPRGRPGFDGRRPGPRGEGPGPRFRNGPPSRGSNESD